MEGFLQTGVLRMADRYLRSALLLRAQLQIGVQYASRQAWIDFLRDANQMGKLRHPNLGEVRCSCMCLRR